MKSIKSISAIIFAIFVLTTSSICAFAEDVQPSATEETSVSVTDESVTDNLANVTEASTDTEETSASETTEDVTESNEETSAEAVTVESTSATESTSNATVIYSDVTLETESKNEESIEINTSDVAVDTPDDSTIIIDKENEDSGIPNTGNGILASISAFVTMCASGIVAVVTKKKK